MYTIWHLAIRSSIWILLSVCTIADAIPQEMRYQQQDADILMSGFMSSVDMATGSKSFIAVIDEIIEIDEGLIVTSYCYGDDGSSNDEQNEDDEQDENDRKYTYKVGNETKVNLSIIFDLFSFLFFFLFSSLHR